MADPTVIEDPVVTVEDHSVVGFDPETESWYVERTTVTEQVIRSTVIDRTSTPSVADALAQAKAHGVPARIRGDDRERAQAELNPAEG